MGSHSGAFDTENEREGTADSAELSHSCSANEPAATVKPQVAQESVALFVSGSPEGVSAKLLQQLAAESDFILAVDAGANQLLAAGITPHLLIGDLDSIDAQTLAQYKAHNVTIESFDPYKNATDVELGIEALYNRGFRRIIATNVLGGRTDHALGSLGALAGAAAERAVEVVLRDEHEVCFFVSSVNGATVLDLCFDEGPIPRYTWSNDVSVKSDRGLTHCREGDDLATAELSLLPKHISLVSWGGPNTVSFTGTEWKLDHYSLSPYSARGISNIVRQQYVRLIVHEGTGTVIVLLTLAQ